MGRSGNGCEHGLTLEGIVETCAECKDVLVRRPSHEAVLREALERIAAGEGRYSRDPLEHAANTIEDMQAIARDALATTETRRDDG